MQELVSDELVAATPTCTLLAAVKNRRQMHAAARLDDLRTKIQAHFGEAACEAEAKRRKKKDKDKRQKARKKAERAEKAAASADANGSTANMKGGKACKPAPPPLSPSIAIPLFDRYHSIAKGLADVRGWSQAINGVAVNHHYHASQKMALPSYSGSHFVGMAPSSGTSSSIGGSGGSGAARMERSTAVPDTFETVLSPKDQKLPRDQVVASFLADLNAQLIGTVHMNYYLGYNELKGVVNVAVQCVDAAYELAAPEVRVEVSNSGMCVFKPSLCLLPLAVYTPHGLGQVIAAVDRVASNAPTTLKYADKLQQYGKHKLVITTDASCTAALKSFGAELKEMLKEIPGVFVGDVPLPHTSVIKVGYSANSKKEKAAATKLAKAARLPDVAKAFPFGKKVLPLEVSTRFRLVQIDGAYRYSAWTNTPDAVRPVERTRVLSSDEKANAELKAKIQELKDCMANDSASRAAASTSSSVDEAIAKSVSSTRTRKVGGGGGDDSGAEDSSDMHEIPEVD